MTTTVPKLTVIIMLILLEFAAAFSLLPAARAATLEVCPSGCAYSSIQAAINAAAPGDVITIGPGVYTGALTIAAGPLTLQGAGQHSVTISTRLAASYGINISGDHITLRDFTVIGPQSVSPNDDYGLKIAGTTGITLENITVRDSFRSGIDLNGVSQAALFNITVKNNGANGLALTDVNTATIDGIATAGNGWGGVALYTYGRYYPGGSSNITLTGSNTFTESNPLYVQLANFTTPASPYPLTNFVQNDFSHTVKNGTGAPNYTFYRLNAPQAITTALGLALPQASYINTLADGSFLVGHTALATMTIQAAVDAAAPGGVINVLPGVYPENVVINKAITLHGAGSGTDPAQHTLLDGSTLGAASGIHLNSGVTNVTIADLTVQNYSTTGSTAGIYAALGNNNFTAQRLHLLNNTGGRAGLHINGPVDSVLIDSVTAYSNTTRGIVIWNGHKTNITLTHNDARYNNCCGIELQDGTASGVTMTDNTVMGNLDSGIAVIGLMGGAGPNLIAGNVISNNGRFGLEVKNPNGSGLDSGDGSIVVENNTVAFTPSAAMNSRDHAGIAIFRRSFQSGNPNGYVDVPTGVVVRNNTVSGWRQENPASSESEGFGIVVEGINHTVTANTVQFNDIGVQSQGGAHPNANYVPNDVGDGDQADGQSPGYFGRGNAPVAGMLLTGNFVSSNTVGIRTVGMITATISANYVYSNTEVGLLALDSSANVNAEGDNQFCDNGLYGLENRGSATLNAANNWWGAADGPGPTGSGDVVTGAVTVEPFVNQAAAGPCAVITATPEPTLTPTPTLTATPEPTLTPTPTLTATPEPNPNPDPEPTLTPTPTLTATPEPNPNPDPEPNPNPDPDDLIYLPIIIK